MRNIYRVVNSSVPTERRNMDAQAREHRLMHLNYEGVPNRRPARGLETPSQPPPAGPDDKPIPPSHPAHRPEAPLHDLIAWIFDKAGLDARHYAVPPLQRRLPACLRALRVHSPDEARSAINQKPSLLTTAVDALLLGVTEFFRDPEVFTDLAGFLPGAIPKNRPLRVLSASCSAGCELYSVAIVLSELGLLSACELVGSDCRAEALDHANGGSYTESFLRQVTLERRNRHFEAHGNALRLRLPLGSIVRWVQQDVFNFALGDLWDVILWRNTSIYLKPTAAQSVWKNLVQSLHPSGLLVTGKAERPLGLPHLTRLTPCIYRTEPA